MRAMGVSRWVPQRESWNRNGAVQYRLACRVAEAQRLPSNSVGQLYSTIVKVIPACGYTRQNRAWSIIYV